MQIFAQKDERGVKQCGAALLSVFGDLREKSQTLSARIDWAPLF
jgi:hypothetical protein